MSYEKVIRRFIFSVKNINYKVVCYKLISTLGNLLSAKANVN